MYTHKWKQTYTYMYIHIHTKKLIVKSNCKYILNWITSKEKNSSPNYTHTHRGTIKPKLYSHTQTHTQRKKYTHMEIKVAVSGIPNHFNKKSPKKLYNVSTIHMHTHTNIYNDPE